MKLGFLVAWYAMAQLCKAWELGSQPSVRGPLDHGRAIRRHAAKASSPRAHCALKTSNPLVYIDL